MKLINDIVKSFVLEMLELTVVIGPMVVIVVFNYFLRH